MYSLAFLLIVGWFSSSQSAQQTNCPPVDLLVEYESSPLGIDKLSPRFSWALCADPSARGILQYGYSIEVNNTDMNTVVWSSGLVVSNSTTNIPYQGTLKADSGFSWRVQWWQDATTSSPWSESMPFTSGLTNEGVWRNASWITLPNASNPTTSPTHVLLRSKSFTLPADKVIARAALYIVGLGYYQVYLDSKQVSTHYLGAFTTFETRVLYDTWDVTALLTENPLSDHVLAVELGPGFYNQHSVNGNRFKLARVLLSVKFTDGSDFFVTSSPDSWTGAVGHVTSVDIYDGEHIDMRDGMYISIYPLYT